MVDADNGAEGEAGPGPGSVRQQQLLQQLVPPLSHGLAAGLAADRCRWPSRTPRMLMESLEVLLLQAGSLTRVQLGKGRGGKGAGAGGTPGGGGGGGSRGKKRGAVSMGEEATRSHAPGDGGKAAAAAAAAVGAVAEAAGGGTTMAAALAAANDVRASALRLVTLLMDCWMECSPGQLATAPELEAVSAMGMIVGACNTLIGRVLLPPSAGGDGAAAGGGGGGSAGSWGAAAGDGEEAGSATAAQRASLLRTLLEVCGSRVAATFPATSPPVRPSAAVAEALAKLNVQAGELLVRFLPLLLTHNQLPQQDPAAGAEQQQQGAVQMPWVPAVVGFYVGLLEKGVVVPAAAGTLSDAAGTAVLGTEVGEAGAGGASVPGGSSDVVLGAVGGAVQCLGGAEAQRLMAAVAAFSERQPPRSAARLACLRMQHGLLQSALAGVCGCGGAGVQGSVVCLDGLCEGGDAFSEFTVQQGVRRPSRHAVT